jgi:hypothetical protein
MSELPRELVIGWAFWVVGGLALTFWFIRQSASPRSCEVVSLPTPSGAARLSGTHAAARPVSGTHAAARALSGTHAAARQSSLSRPVALQPQSGSQTPDVFEELRALIDAPEDPPRAG